MKIGSYLRVSTSWQSVEAQRLELATWLGSRPAREFSDVISGAKSDRPGLEALLAAIEAREIDTVVCVKLDRLGRSLAHLAKLVEFFSDHEVALICTSQGIDTTNNNACGKFQLDVLSAVAAFERELIRERTRAGLAAARARGAVIGRPSLKLKGVDRDAVCSTWQAEGRPGGYRGLGERLGGVGKMTAWRIFRDRAVAPEIA